ncbi:MAG: hypothetical protein ACR2HR_07235 [Euzebya sp.]
MALFGLLILLVGCGPALVDRAQDDPSSEALTPSSSPSSTAGESTAAGLDAHVYADQATLPMAEAYEHVGVATTAGQLQQQWQRFGFADVPPVIDMVQRHVLFLGFGESGSCPVVFGGIEVDGAILRLIDDQPEQGCTDDYNPRTLAVSVAAGVLPDGYLTVDMPADAEDVTISMSGTEEPPPATADPVSASISDVSLVPEPARAPLGTTIDVLIHNGTADDGVGTGQVVTIDRWTGYHFETLGQVFGGDGVIEVGPQETGQLLALDTGDPEFPTGEPGWFRLTVQLDVTTGGFGRIDARGNLQLTEPTAEVSEGSAVITSGPPCIDGAACAAGIFIGDVRYEQSCGLVDPTVVSDTVYATGEGITAHILDGVDPRVMLAWETSCEPPLTGRWHVLFAADRLGTPEYNGAWCRAALNPPDPAEGFSC